MKPNALVSPGLVKSGLRRFWPLWLALFVGLVLSFDAPVYTAAIECSHQQSLAEQLNAMTTLWEAARFGSLFFALAASIVVSVALNEYLFDSRAATFVGSLPLKRRSVFASYAVVGLLALLAVLALAALCLLPLRLVVGPIFSLGKLAGWFGLTSIITFVMYAFAQLACQLAGTRPVAVLLYAVINTLAVCLEAALQLVVSALQYGMYEAWTYVSDKITPIVSLGEATLIFTGESLQWSTIAGYTLAAVVVLVGSAMLFERRHLESAGESVAVPVLRPILKYLAGISMALLFGAVLCMLHYSNMVYGVPMGSTGAIALAVCLVVGGALGLIFAEMIMRRSAHVLGRCWRGALVLAALSVAFVGVCWFDLLGVAHRVPDAGEVKLVSMQCDYSDATTLESAENIADVCDLQRDIIAYGGVTNSDNSYMNIRMIYQLKNGRTIMRSYPIFTHYAEYRVGEAPADEGALLIERYREIANTKEGRASRYADVLDAASGEYRYTLEYCEDEETGQYASIKLAGEDLADFVENALRPDLMEGPAGEAVTGYGESEGAIYDAELSVENKKTGNVPLYLQIDSVNTPHIIAWFHEHYPNVQLQTW